MIMSIIYFILAGLGLSFLVLIHELGHYIVARRNGIRVEVFSVGFGRPIVKWKMDGVEWRICWILFGGYVKPAGLDREGNVDPHDVEGGFYHSSPWARIKVAVMGPIVNIVCAFVFFSIIWFCGGRDQPFAKHTKLVGYVDPKSELFTKGIRPGDEIDQIDGRQFRGFQDLMYSAVTAKEQVTLKGKDINYFSQQKVPFEMSIASYPDPRMNDVSFKTFGILHPARYLIYDDFAQTGDNPIPESSPMFNSGIQRGDRIVWVNSSLIFSVEQLGNILNKQTSLVSVIRNGKEVNVEVPKVKIRDLRFTRTQMAELDDWQHEVALKSTILDSYFIPYNLSGSGVVLSGVKYIDDNSNEASLKGEGYLHKGDKIVAIDSQKVTQAYQVLAFMQRKMANIIVQRNENYSPKSWMGEDSRFMDSVDYKDLASLIAVMDNQSAPKQLGNLVLLNPVEPLSQSNFSYSEEHRLLFDQQMAAAQKQISEIKDPKKQQAALIQFAAMKDQRKLGLALQDRQVIYNPNPVRMVGDVVSDTYRTLSSLVTGNLSPKWLSGPVGFVQVMHHGWSVGYKEALYWMGVISMGLGIFNLLPIPALDGGHICFSLYELITRKKVSVKVMERMVLPFAVLLIGLILFVTFQDVLRIFK